MTDSPIDVVGALPLDSFLPKSERRSLAGALNTLLASPTFASWRTGATLDVDAWLTLKDDRTPAVVVSVAHLDDDERALVLGVLLEEVLSWVRAQPASKRLRSLVVFDEVYGFLPPHPANPPTKHAIVSLMKQARAFGVGVLRATQNPMDLDYRALSNAGLWWVGRLQTDADRERVVEGLAGEGAGDGEGARERGEEARAAVVRAAGCAGADWAGAVATAIRDILSTRADDEDRTCRSEERVCRPGCPTSRTIELAAANRTAPVMRVALAIRLPTRNDRGNRCAEVRLRVDTSSDGPMHHVAPRQHLAGKVKGAGIAQ